MEDWNTSRDAILRHNRYGSEMSLVSATLQRPNVQCKLSQVARGLSPTNLRIQFDHVLSRTDLEASGEWGLVRCQSAMLHLRESGRYMGQLLVMN